jgi:hypothetical protein
MNVVTAVEQSGFGIHPANGGFSGDHSFESGAVGWLRFGRHGSSICWFVESLTVIAVELIAQNNAAQIPFHA